MYKTMAMVMDVVIGLRAAYRCTYGSGLSAKY